MKHCRVSAFARVARVIAYAAVALGLGAASLLAQSTGKLEGRVRDQAGAPIANAQVILVGTAFNAVTNPQGYYFVNNVPAGPVTVRAQFIGYKSTQVEGVKVLAGQTASVDVQLEQTPVAITEITVVAQTQPLVPRDEVTTKQRIDGVFTENLPVDRLNSVLALQPGVVASPTANTISIRGGRTDEAVTYVDGVPITAGYRGGSNLGSLGTELSLGTNSLEEASVTTGSSSAEFGNAQSGVIAAQIRSGTNRYQGSLNYESDEPFGKNSSLGFNRVQGSLSGPIARNFTFFLSGSLEGQKAVAMGKDAEKSPMFVQAGIDTVLAVPSALGDPTADTTPRSGVQLRGVSRRVLAVRGQRQPGHRKQLRRRLPGRPHPVLGPHHVQPHRQTQLQLRHRFAVRLHRPGQPVPRTDDEPEPGPHGPGAHSAESLQPGGVDRVPQHEPGLHAQLDAEPEQVRRARPGAGDVHLLSAGPHGPGADDARDRSRHPRSVRRVHPRQDGFPDRLRQLPDQRGAGRQLPAEPAGHAAGARRPEQPGAVRLERRLPQQPLRALQPGLGRRRPPVLRERARRPAGQPGDHVSGESLGREGQPRLAGRPVQPHQGRRRVHPLRDRQLHAQLGRPDLLRHLPREADPVERLHRRPARSGRRGPGGRPAVRLVPHPRQAPGRVPAHHDQPGVRSRTTRTRSSTIRTCSPRTRATTT